MKYLSSHAEEMGAVKAYLSKDNMHVIEAGCGRGWPPGLANPTMEITGVDCDEAALRLRTDLAHSILGDICKVQLPEKQADVVYSAYVLEHVQGAEQALENFFRWTKDGGVVILRIPDRNSVFGVVTRLTPHWVHVAYHRWILGRKIAGQPGTGPYPTYYDAIVSRPGIREFCARHGYEIVEEFAVATHFRNRFKWLIAPFCFGVSVLSFGTLAWRHSNLHYVIRKPLRSVERAA